MPTDPNRRPALSSRMVQRILLGLYRWKGWKIEGRRPDCEKFIILGAPHTSNWDFVFFLGAANQLGIKPSFMGKTSLFKWPMTNFVLDMGGVPVDRTKRGKYVDQVAAAFEASDELALVIAPEGSRTFKGAWRTGFYHIAMAAGVPIARCARRCEQPSIARRQWRARAVAKRSSAPRWPFGTSSRTWH